MKVLIFGKGYIGNSFFSSTAFDSAFISGADITSREGVASEVLKYKPDVLVNCAGKTNLEWCRDNKLEAMRVNIAGPLNLLSVAKDNGLYLVHIGSGCIFEGGGALGRGFSEGDVSTPAAFYSYTKVMADELLTRSGYGNFLILRIRQPFSLNNNPRNLITKLLGYEKLITSQNSATYIPDLIAATKFLIDKKANGIFNITNNGTISPYEIVSLAKEVMKLNKNFIPISKAELDVMDKLNKREKRVDTIINISKLESTGFKMPDVKPRIIESLNFLKNFV